MTEKPFKPLLAASTTEADLLALTFPLVWSPKLDGIRTMIHEIGPVSRKIKLIPNEKLRAFLDRPELKGFDGEMTYGPVTDKDVFNRTQSAVMSIDGPAPQEAEGKYLVFDDFTDPDMPFFNPLAEDDTNTRFGRLKARVAALPEELRAVVQVVPHRVVSNHDDLLNIERVVVEKNYEGVMLRSPGGRYKYGRSTLREMILAKVKRFADDEATIVDFEEMMHNDNEQTRDALGHAKRATLQENLRPAGTLGALVVFNEKYAGIQIGNTVSDGRFRIGSGFTAAMKQDFWDRREELRGKKITFKYQPSGMKDLPRFPVFKGFRKD